MDRFDIEYMKIYHKEEYEAWVEWMKERYKDKPIEFKLEKPKHNRSCLSPTKLVKDLKL